MHKTTYVTHFILKSKIAEPHPRNKHSTGTALKRLWRAEHNQERKVIPPYWGTGCAEESNILKVDRVGVQMKQIKDW